MHQDTAGGQSPGYKRRTSTRIQQEDKHQDTVGGQAPGYSKRTSTSQNT